MFKKIVFISIFSILSVAVFGQGKITLKEERLSDLQPQMIGKTFKFQVGYLFKVDGGEYEAVGYKGERLEKLLKADEAAYKEFKKFKRKVVISKVGYYVGLSAFVAIPFIIQDDDTESEKGAKVGTVLGLSTIGLTISTITHYNSTKHLANAVEIYNQGL